jgi:hypothetical protein
MASPHAGIARPRWASSDVRQRCPRRESIAAVVAASPSVPPAIGPLPPRARWEGRENLRQFRLRSRMQDGIAAARHPVAAHLSRCGTQSVSNLAVPARSCSCGYRKGSPAGRQLDQLQQRAQDPIRYEAGPLPVTAYLHAGSDAGWGFIRQDEGGGAGADGISGSDWRRT